MQGAPIAEIDLVGARLSLVAGEELVRRVVAEAARGGHGYVCVANVHQVTHAWREPMFRQTLQEARWVSTDSRVLELALAALGHRYSSEVTYGIDVFEDICAAAAEAGVRIGLFGGSPEIARELVRRLRAAFPALDLRLAHAPSFGTAAELADDATLEMIDASGVQVLLVGLGCPKQEIWMQLAARRVGCMMVGVGAAFDFYAGEMRAAPARVRQAGFDWLWRLASEPRRLWRRYLVGNSLFLARIVPAICARRLLSLLRRSPGSGGAFVSQDSDTDMSS
jgi:N-acetylglucosaminyldiphosphoundecaprenol N-acetyl-beta-D-mannosaminyltransferase